MTGKIYRGILISTVITMLACLIFTVGVQYQIYDEKSYKELRSKAEIISVAAEENRQKRRSGKRWLPSAN